MAFEAPALIVGTVAVLCGLIAGAAWRAMVRTGNRNIGLVVGAFVLLSAKNLVKAIELAAGQTETVLGELVFSLVDLVAVGMIAAPLFLRKP